MHHAGESFSVVWMVMDVLKKPNPDIVPVELPMVQTTNSNTNQPNQRFSVISITIFISAQTLVVLLKTAFGFEQALIKIFL